MVGLKVGVGGFEGSAEPVVKIENAIGKFRHAMGAGYEVIRQRLVAMDIEHEVDAGLTHTMTSPEYLWARLT